MPRNGVRWMRLRKQMAVHQHHTRRIVWAMISFGFFVLVLVEFVALPWASDPTTTLSISTAGDAYRKADKDREQVFASLLEQFQCPEKSRPPLSSAVDLSAVKQVLTRRLAKEEATRVKIVLDETLCNRKECFTFSFHKYKLVVTGSTLSSIGRGIGILFRDVCGMELISWASRGQKSQQQPQRLKSTCIQRLVAIAHRGEEEREDDEASDEGLEERMNQVKCFHQPCQARVRFRYYLNQVTWSYSMAWWGWNRWEEELDWMFLRGINIALAHTGQEAIWYRVWKRVSPEGNFNWPDFFTGVAYLSWHRMGNLQRLGAPLSVSWMTKQVALQHNILSRMAQLGITPILPAFNLHVPEQLGLSHVEPSSFWSGFMNEKSGVLRLEPNATAARLLSKLFLSEQLLEYKELSAFSQRYYSVDLFNEMDPGETDVGAAFRTVFEPVNECDPESVLVVQMWCFAHNPEIWNTNRVRAFMDAVPAERVLYLDLHGEKRPQWKRLKKILRNERLVWTYLHNFGGTKGLAGEMEVLEDAVETALEDSPHVRGIGLAMEGIEQNEMVYDYVLSKGWSERDQTTYKDWIQHWVLARYRLNEHHSWSTQAVQAWECALSTVYSRPALLSGWGNTKSVIELRPWFNLEQSAFQPTKLAYEPQDFVECARDLYRAARDIWAERGNVAYVDWRKPDMQTLLYDVVDFVRQTVCDAALQLSKRLDSEMFWKRSKKAGTAEAGQLLILLIRRLGKLLDKHWMWREAMDDVAHDMVDTPQVRDFRTLFTYWSKESSLLHSYASRQSAQLVTQVYLPRWRAWVNTLSKGMPNRKRMGDIFSKIEDDFIAAPVLFNQTKSLEPRPLLILANLLLDSVEIIVQQ